MTQKAYIMHELAGRGYTRYDQVPEEMLDYLPENLDDEQDEDDRIIDDGGFSPWYIQII